MENDLTQRIKFLKLLDIQNVKFFRYRNLTGTGLSKKIKRLLLFHLSYIRFAGAKAGIFSSDIPAKLFFGKKIRIPISDVSSPNLIFSGTLGSGELRLTKFFIKTLNNDDIFYDVGANYGFYTHLANTLITTGEVHAFEPSPSVFKYLTQAAGDRTFLNKVALSNQENKTEFFDAQNSSGRGTINPSVAEHFNKSKEKLYVEAIKCDTYVEKHTPPSIIKIDVEGAEYLVLRGGEKTFKKYSPTIILEVWGGARGTAFSKKATDLLMEWKYVPFKIDSQGEICKVHSILPEKIKQYENFVFKKMTK